MFKDSLCTAESFNSKEERASVFSVCIRTQLFDGCFGSSQAVTVAAHTVKVFWVSLSYLELRAQRVELGDNLAVEGKNKRVERAPVSN